MSLRQPFKNLNSYIVNFKSFSTNLRVIMLRKQTGFTNTTKSRMSDTVTPLHRYTLMPKYLSASRRSAWQAES